MISRVGRIFFTFWIKKHFIFGQYLYFCKWMKNGNTMATYTITINERSAAGKALLNYLLSLGVIDTKTKVHRKGLDEAIEDVKHGRTIRCSSFEEYQKKINE